MRASTTAEWRRWLCLSASPGGGGGTASHPAAPYAAPAYAGLSTCRSTIGASSFSAQRAASAVRACPSSPLSLPPSAEERASAEQLRMWPNFPGLHTCHSRGQSAPPTSQELQELCAPPDSKQHV
eukprot:8070577-Pyramimonas_sp.AAC.1